MRHLRSTLLLAGLLWAGPASAAGRSIGDQLDRMNSDLSEVESRLAGLDREYGQRRGLIGGEDARQRYEEAVFRFLIGEYETSALSFYTLVESGALGDGQLHLDAEWYLAESVFEMGNWATALEAYGRIMDAGESHPFFDDSVRRQLEVLGLVGDTERFYEIYRTWVLSGRVPTTPAVRYTVAKSFYRQGENARAKAMFGEQPAETSYYGRSRYFLGTILAADGDFEQAAVEFEAVVAAPSTSDEVSELARLALGRVNYEMERYQEAVEHYQSLPSDSKWFADQLYELVWTYIKQEDWDNALRHVEIFLIAFPAHPYTLQMKLNQGHLHMKAKGFERALASYETVVADYTPLRERLDTLEGGVGDPIRFFERIAADAERMQSVDGSGYADGGLPGFAVEMLVDDNTMGRVVDASRALNGQRADLTAARVTLDEISGVLTSSDEAIGTFGRGRQALLRVRDDSLQLRHRLLEAELAYLQQANDRVSRARVQSIEEEMAVLLGRTQQVQGVESDRTDRYQVHEDQVRAVQDSAMRLLTVAGDLKAEIVATRRVLREKASTMAVVDIELVEDELERVESDLQVLSRELEGAASNATLRQVMASVPRGRAGDTDGDRKLLSQDYDRLHGVLRGMRDGMTGDLTPLRTLDDLWTRTASLDGRSSAVQAQLDKAEVSELAILRAGVREQDRAVAALTDEVGAVDQDASRLAADITRWRFGTLKDQLSSNIMEADMGIVDVYWLRKTEVVSERTRLATERSERLQELTGRFELIRQPLEE